MYKNIPHERYRRTLEFMQKSVSPPARIMDMGIDNPFSVILRERGYDVINSGGEDLDLDQSALRDNEYDILTGFEILEHVLNPMGILKAVKCDRIFLSVPLKIWFDTAYRSKTDMWDRHYHEFEDWQFDWLLEKSGWKVIRSEKWNSLDPLKLGIRPILRKFTPRYYIVEALRVPKA